MKEKWETETFWREFNWPLEATGERGEKKKRHSALQLSCSYFHCSFLLLRDKRGATLNEEWSFRSSWFESPAGSVFLTTVVMKTASSLSSYRFWKQWGWMWAGGTAGSRPANLSTQVVMPGLGISILRSNVSDLVTFKGPSGWVIARDLRSHFVD